MSMTVVKTAISMDAELLASIKAAVAAGEARSVSAYLAGAVRQRQRKETLAEFVAEQLEATGGPETDEELAEMARAFGTG